MYDGNIVLLAFFLGMFFSLYAEQVIRSVVYAVIRWADAQQKEKEKMDEFEKWLESLPDTHFRGMDEMEIAKEAFYAGKKAAEHHMHTDAAKWNCPKCNYVNFSDERVCIVCETAAPVM